MPASRPWSWSVSGGIEALSVMAGVRFDLLFHDFDAICRAYREGIAIARERFGLEVPWGQPRWASISYGHINCLGAELHFPEASEVGVVPLYASLREGVDDLRHRIDLDFTRSGLFPRYLSLWKHLQQEFPQLPVQFTAFGVEGPLTTAWMLRGQDWFYDIYDDPPLAQEFLSLITDSLIAYEKTLARINGHPENFPAGVGIADDGAAMLPPSLWPELVVPFLERFYAGLTNGLRSLHCENLTVAHLPFLDQLQIGAFDPSVSPQLSPSLLRGHCGVPFSWRLNSIEYRYFSPDDARQWVHQAALEGADQVHTIVWRNNATARDAAIVEGFRQGAREVAATRQP